MNAIDVNEVAMPLGGGSPSSSHKQSHGRVMGTATKAASFGVLLFSTTVLIMMVYTLRTTKAMTAGWGDFALHPILMTLGFGFLAPIALTSYRLLEDVFGVSHYNAKMVHGVLLTAALLCGILGVIDMWIVHGKGANGWENHLVSVHSWLGLAAILAFSIQWLTGAWYYWAGVPTIPAKKAWMPAHILLGSFAAFGTLASITLGILSFDYPGAKEKSKTDGYKVYNTPEQIQFKVISLFVGVTAFCLAVAMRRR